MARLKFQWFFCLCISHSTLLGVYVFLLDLCRCQVFSGVKWPPYSPAVLSGLSDNQPALELPQIHSPQARLTVPKGATIDLPCKVHNLGESQVLWRRGTNVLAGTNVTTYSDDRIQFLCKDIDFTLQISRVTQSDEGDYECIVTSWPTLSLIHSVVVHDAPTVTLITPSSMKLTEGDSVEIGCIPHGNPLPKIYWSMRDGQIPIHNATALNQPRLKLENVSRRYTGLYVCTADNGIGRPAIGAVYVRVLYTPEIEIPKRRVHGGVGFRANIIAFVHSDPRPQVYWRKGKEIVSASDRVYTETFGNNEYRIVFDPVKTSNFGTYIIEANNSLGIDVKTIEFSGVPNPPILTRWETESWRHSTAEELTIDEIEVTLYWSVECYSPLIDYRLFFRPAPIPQLNSFNEDQPPPWAELNIPADQSFSSQSRSFLHTKSFTLRGLKNSTIYEAAVKARNRYGSSPLSSVCFFATFPNSSSSKADHLEEIMIKMRTPAVEDSTQAGETDGFSEPENEAAKVSSRGNNLFGTFILWILVPVMIFSS